MDLVGRAIAGEPLALDRLLLDSYPKLLARVDQKLPAEMRGAIAPEDIIQETFTQAFNGVAGFRPDGGEDSFYRWLATIADHRVIDAVRAHKAAKRGGGRAEVVGPERSSVATLIGLLAVNEWTPSRSAAGHEAAAAIQVALAGLKEEYREALTLRYLDALSVPETAAKMGKTEPAIHKLCSRGLQALRESMGEAVKYLSRG